MQTGAMNGANTAEDAQSNHAYRGQTRHAHTCTDKMSMCREKTKGKVTHLVDRSCATR
jgi:hypothetical protein